MNQPLEAILNRLLAVPALFLLSVPALVAQNANGGLLGVVQDGTQARVAGAAVDLRQVGSGLTRHLTADATGQFRAEDLKPGEWVVAVDAKGFASAKAEVAVVVSSTRSLTVTLQPAGLVQTVGVKAVASSITTQPIDLTSDVHQAVVSTEDLEGLPLPARSFANIAYLAPGTEPVEPSDPTKARITAVSTGGSSGLNNELSVDGGDNSDDYIGGFLQNFSPDSIQEFAIKTGQEDADTGGTTAGSVVITTKSGTNALDGSATVYERAAALNARFPIENPAPNPKQPFSRQNYVGTLGGPIVKDKLFFFVSFENVHENASIAYSPASTTEFNALAQLAADGLVPGGITSIAVPSSVAIPFRDYFSSLRLDWAQSARSEWFLRPASDTYTTHNALVQQGTLPSTGLLTHNNYLSLVGGNQYAFSPSLLGRFTFNASGLHLTQTRNSNLGFALAFPFSSTSLTVSGYETFGDNQFATPITFFPSERNQEKYQARYDLTKTVFHHTLTAGINFIHEPVLGGQFPSNDETLYSLPNDPTYYVTNQAQFTADLAANQTTTNLGGGFAQNIQRFAAYAEDSFQATRHLTLNLGLRYSTTIGLFNGSGRTLNYSPAAVTLAALEIPLVAGNPTDDKKQFAPRVGFAYAPGTSGKTVIRAGFGLFYDDLAQTGWATAFQGLNSITLACVDPVQNPTGGENVGCLTGGSMGNLIDPHYRTPYSIHTSIGAQHAFGAGWSVSADYIHEQGNHGYRAYSYTGGVNLFTPELAVTDPNQANVVPNINVYHSDNRSSYDGLLTHVQGRVGHRFSLVANYTFSKAQTWGCVLGELFDYVNGVCDPLNAFAPGDYGPSGEDVRHRGVLAGTWKAPLGFEVSGISQAESARPFTITTTDNSARISVDGVPTTLDEFRATPYLQTDLRVSRTIHLGERWSAMPFVEFFNLFNRNNPGANYITNAGALPVPTAEAQAGNLTDICTNADCSATQPITSLKQLGFPGGALGDFFGPGTTVGTPFAAQLGLRVLF